MSAPAWKDRPAPSAKLRQANRRYMCVACEGAIQKRGWYVGTESRKWHPECVPSLPQDQELEVQG